MNFIIGYLIPFIVVFFGCPFVYTLLGIWFGIQLLGIWVLSDHPEKPKDSETKWDECPNLPYEVVQELWNERDPNINYELEEDDFS